MDKKILLSVCIPTYNGAAHIGANIDRVLTEISVHNLHGIEIVISDNCSTDNTEAIVKPYLQKHSGIIKYSKNPQNLGFDANIIKCCNLSNGEYIHFLGNDDAYSDGALKKIMDILHTHSGLAGIVISTAWFDEKQQKLEEPLAHLSGDVIAQDSLITDKNKLLRITAKNHTASLVNILFKKSYFREIYPIISPITDYAWWVCILIYITIASKHSDFFVTNDREPLVICKFGTQNWPQSPYVAQILHNNIKVFSLMVGMGFDKEIFEDYKAWYAKEIFPMFKNNLKISSLCDRIKYFLKLFKFYKNKPNLYWRIARAFFL